MEYRLTRCAAYRAAQSETRVRVAYLIGQNLANFSMGVLKAFIDAKIAVRQLGFHAISLALLEYVGNPRSPNKN